MQKSNYTFGCFCTIKSKRRRRLSTGWEIRTRTRTGWLAFSVESTGKKADTCCCCCIIVFQKSQRLKKRVKAVLSECWGFQQRPIFLFFRWIRLFLFRSDFLVETKIFLVAKEYIKSWKGGQFGDSDGRHKKSPTEKSPSEKSPTVGKS